MSDMRTVCSTDGTTIAWYHGGPGPALLCIGGALEDHTAWSGLGACLPGIGMHVIERRGRGASGDQPGPADEIADVHAVLESIATPREPAVLAGHSSGALLALNAAAGTPLVRAVIAYEPPAPPRAGRVSTGLRELIAAGDREAALLRFLTDAVGVPEAAARARLTDTDLALAHTLPYDALIAERGYPAEPDREVTVPVMLLLGTESPPRAADHVAALARRLPGSLVRTLPGQGHFALGSAPALVAAHVRDAMHGVGGTS